MEFFEKYISPIGPIIICSDGESITKIYFTDRDENPVCPCELTGLAMEQLDQYFKAERFQFSIPLNPEGTVFQKQIWNELTTIPFGHTQSYGEIAIKTGDANNMRAVGNANSKNPIAIMIPCHRVIGTSGKLTGYAGGLWRKRWLLLHELKNNPSKLTLF